MAEEIFKLKTLDVENTLVRQSRVGFKNNPTSKLVFASPDTVGREIYSGETGIYSGERNVNTEYLIQGSVDGNNIRTEATFTNGSKEVVLSSPVSGLKEGDKIRNDIDNSFFEIKSATDTVITLNGNYQSDNFSGSSYTGPATIRKEKIENAEFEYVRSLDGENRIFFNQDKIEWGITGVEATGPLDTQKEPYVFPSDDYMVAQFQESATAGAPVITAVKSERFTVVNDNKNPIADLALNAIPYPHETLKVYWGPKDGTLPLKTEGVDYVVNYSQEPDYQFPFPPIEDRQVAFLKFLEEIDEKQATINEDFAGYIAISKTTEVPGADDLVTSITDIVPDSEEVKVASAVVDKNKDYIIDYESGLTTFVEHKNNESLVQSVSYPRSLLWDGVTVIRGVKAEDVKGSLDPNTNENLVIRGISGLTGIEGTVYYEDTEENNLVRDDDYLLEYDSGAIRINDALEEDESVLVSYYVEGEEEENEDLLQANELRTKKFPVMAGSVVLTKVYTDVVSQERSKVLEEGVDYQISSLTGAIRPLAESLSGDNIKSLDISYVPMAQMNVILQPNPDDDNSFKMTIVDDALEITSPVALKFKVRNPQISVPEEDPFKGDDDPTKVSYANSIISDSIQNVSIRIRSGFGTAPEELLLPGVTEQLGVDTDTDFDTEGYIYDDELKEIQLDESKNDVRPDFNDVVVMTYSFIGDTLPYIPVEAIFPLIAEGSSEFYIEGHDRTDLLKPNSVLRVDNFNPEEIYYVKLKSVSFDGESTKVEIYGTFPTDVRNPSFFLFDSDVPFVSLPSNTQVVSGLKPGSEEIRVTGNLLQVKELVEPDSLLQIDGSEIYRVQSVTTEEGVGVINIFPALQSYIEGDVLVSSFPVRDEDSTIILPKLNALVDPPQPAFTISFVPPTDPVELSGRGLITIDTEKIILQEIVSGFTNPEPYLFYFKNYSDLYAMAKAIQATKSTFMGLNYMPFTVSVGGEEQYYLSDGAWKTDTIIPFEEGIEEGLPYTITITPDMYKWKLISAEKNLSNFTIEEADVSSSFSDGNLLAFTSKVTGDTYYHIISGAAAEDNPNDDSLKDTKVTIRDEFRINFTDPYFYIYNNPVWLDLPEIFTIDTENSSLTFNSDLSKTLRKSMFLKFGNTHVYKIDTVIVDSGVTTVNLSPDIYEDDKLLITGDSYAGYVQYTDIPLYINEVSHQPSLTFTYTEAAAHTGYAEISVDDEKIEILEYVDGSDTVSKTNTYEFSNYTDIYQLGLAIRETDSAIAGHKPYYVNVEAYQGLYELGGFSRFSIVPTYGVKKRLPYFTLVAQANFEIQYTLAPSYTGTASIKRKADRLVLKESLVHTVDGAAEQEYELVYANYPTIYQLFDAIDALSSTITGTTPFVIDTFSGQFDPVDFFTRGTYNIPSVAEDEFSDLTQAVPATTNTATWGLQGPLNLRRLTFEEDYTVANGTVTFATAIQRRDRFLFNYLGLDTLSEFEPEDINVSCRFYSTLPTGYRVDAYMDYLNVDQYYIQKLTERKFLEIVTVPQVGDLLQQKGGGGGSGADSGSNDGFPNYQAGIANLYYQLRDEQIKKMLYLKLYEWYKHRLRYFAAEAQISTGFKFGNSTHYWTNGSYYTLLDSLVEQDINYTLTTQDIIDQIENGFTVFFPFGYKGVSPKYYDRFRDEYLDYKDVYCYNVKYVDDDITTGKVRAWKPYWAPKADGKLSDLDYSILRSSSSELVSGYSVPFYSTVRNEANNFKDELIYDSDSTNYSFLKRVNVGDEVKIENKKSYYKIAEIQNRVSDELLAETLVFEEGKSFTEKGIKTYKVSKYTDVIPGNDTYLYRFSISLGYFQIGDDDKTSEFVSGLRGKYGYTTLAGQEVAGSAATGGVVQLPSGSYYRTRSKRINKFFTKSYVDVFVKIDVFESTFPYEGNRIYIKRQAPESFPAYDDYGNYGVTLNYRNIKGQKTGSNRIRKSPTVLEVLQILFPIPFAFFPEAPEYFMFTGGTFDEDTGEYTLGSYDYATEVFDGTDSEANKEIDLSALNFFEERRVSDNLDAITNNIVVEENSDGTIKINDDGYAVIDGVIYDGDTDAGSNHSSKKLREGDIIPTSLQKGLNKFVDTEFDRKYLNDDNIGYIDAIYFKTKSRDVWFDFPGVEEDEYVTQNYGVPLDQTLKGFYDPTNIYTKLVLEKQAWLTEQLIVEDIYDVQLKLARAFENGILNNGAGAVVEGDVATNINHSQFRDFLIGYDVGGVHIKGIGEIIIERMDRYRKQLEFLIRNTPGDLGPIAGIIQEDDASGPIIESYEKGVVAYNTYSNFLAKSFVDDNSFYNRMVSNIKLWTNAYIRWILSIREGTVFQLSARDDRINNLIYVGFNLLDAVGVTYETSTDTVILSDPQATVDYDLFNQSLRLKLNVDYQQVPGLTNPDTELESGSIEAVYLFKDYATLGSLVSAINEEVYPYYDPNTGEIKTKGYPLGVQFFNAELLFEHYPKGDYTTLRISPFTATDIPEAGLTVQVLNVDDHRQFDSRVLFLDKDPENLLALDNEPPLNPWPTYISYYNDPTNTDYADPSNYQPKKAAIQGLKVPGSWNQLPSSYYDVIRFNPLQTDYETSYLITAVYDEDELNDIVSEQTLNLILPDRDKVSSMISIVNKIDSTGDITPDELTFVEETDRSQRTKDIFIKFLTVKLSQFGEEITIRFNTRRFRTINDLVTAMNGYFYKDDNGEWQPARTTDNIQDPKFVRLFDAELLGDPLDQGESSSFEIQIPYEPVIRSFRVGPYEETYTIITPSPVPGPPVTTEVTEQYYVDKENVLLGWVPEIRTVDEGQQITLRLNDELEYSPGNTYGFNPYTGEDARQESIRINSEHPNADILPFDIYSWDSNATYEIRSNWFLMRSDNVQEAVPLTGALGTATFVSAINNFQISGTDTYPELEGETVGELVDRINASPANAYFYANLKFVRDPNDDNQVGYFEYTYLPNALSQVPQATLETIFLADDSEVIRLSPNRAENAQYQMDQVVPNTTPPSIENLTINSDVKVFDMSLNNGAYSSISNATYNFNTGSNLIALTADYVYDLDFSISLDLSKYATVSELINGNVSYDGINDILAPLLTGPTVNLFSASAIAAGADPTTLRVTSTVALPETLKDTTDANILSISAATIVDSRISLSNATVRVSTGSLTLSATLTYTGSYSGSVGLAQSVSNVVADIGAQYPLGDDGTYFASLFNSSVISTAYNNTQATGINGSGGAQPFTTTVTATISVSEDFATTGTLEDLVNSINSKAPLTGVDASYLFTADPGYKGLHASFVTPAEGDSYDALNSLTGSKDFGAVFSAEPGLKLLFMENGGSYQVTPTSITATMTLGTETFIQSTNKDLDSWVDSITGDFNSGFRGIDVLPIKVPGVTYGLLVTTVPTSGTSNPPTHVQFGFLGDFKFTQISDYNLFTELSMIKQRLAKPWKNDDGTYEDDWYNDINYYNDFYGRTDASADGNTIALHIDKFLGYIKNTRFSEIKNSIQNEQLVNNKYLWLYLKFHREIGCDQKVRDLFKKIQEDEQDSDELPQDL